MKKRFFTLVEILVACGIIAILAGMGFAGYRYAMNSGRINSTKGITGQISTALESCYNKFGFYPDSSAFESITITLDGDIPDTIKFGSVSYDKDDTVVLRKQFFRHHSLMQRVSRLPAAKTEFCSTVGETSFITAIPARKTRKSLTSFPPVRMALSVPKNLKSRVIRPLFLTAKKWHVTTLATSDFDKLV